MPIKPRNDLVLVKRLEEKYTGTLVLPETALEKPTLAVVVAVGPGAVNEHFPGLESTDPCACGAKDHGTKRLHPARVPIDLAPGDVVFIGRYSGVEIEEKGEKLLFLREGEILGKRG